MSEYAIIVAGGKGTRMSSLLPKQFLMLKGKPVLMHTIEKFYSYSNGITIILGLPQDDLSRWDRLCKEHSFEIPHQVVIGGTSRFQTVKNCLNTLSGEGIVAIHDGVRPLVSKAIIDRCFKTTISKGSAIASVDLKESIRELSATNSKAVNRSNYKLIQTPQVFKLKEIQQAYKREEESWMTDDAGVAEHAGLQINLIEGEYSNIKITTPSDLMIAEALFSVNTKD